jgi:hypothetical protein
MHSKEEQLQMFISATLFQVPGSPTHGHSLEANQPAHGSFNGGRSLDLVVWQRWRQFAVGRPCFRAIP